MQISISNTIRGFQYGGGAPSTDPDAQAFFDRVTAAGGTLTTTEQTAVNTLTISLKAVGVWTLMKAIYPMVGSSAAACAQNLKSSSFTGIFSSGWIFASGGITGNTANTFLNTQFIPSAQLTLTSGHYSIYSRTNINQLSIDLGVDNGSVHQVILQYNGDQVYSYASSNTGQIIANTDSLGHYITNRNSVTNTNGFKNGNQVITGVEVAGLPTTVVYIGGRNLNGVVVAPTSRQYAFASCGDGLTNVQASNFYTVVQAFQTSLSRNV